MIITVVESHSILDIPPTINLTRTLLKLGHDVNLVANNVNLMDERIKNNSKLNLVELDYGYPDNISFARKMQNRIKQKKELRHIVDELMKESDVLWTTSDHIVRDLGDDLLKYKHVFHLMELMQHGYQFRDKFEYDIAKYARHAWKNVVAEENRAYIEKVWWDLKEVPFVFPNKPYSLDFGKIGEAEEKAIDQMKKERKKIILYLGGIWPDRDLDTFAKIINKTEEYRLCVVGKAFSEESKKQLNKMISEYNVLYLGSFPSPKHLSVISNAHIGLLPYVPVTGGYLSELNALYCAPNKIFEYAGFGIPMLGTDVMGLKYPFEKYDIGEVCKSITEKDVIAALQRIEANYLEKKANALKYYDLYDLEEIVKTILLD